MLPRAWTRDDTGALGVAIVVAVCTTAASSLIAWALERWLPMTEN